jgi:hypothetical protein
VRPGKALEECCARELQAVGRGGAQPPQVIAEPGQVCQWRRLCAGTHPWFTPVHRKAHRDRAYGGHRNACQTRLGVPPLLHGADCEVGEIGWTPPRPRVRDEPVLVDRRFNDNDAFAVWRRTGWCREVEQGWSAEVTSDTRGSRCIGWAGRLWSDEVHRTATNREVGPRRDQRLLSRSDCRSDWWVRRRRCRSRLSRPSTRDRDERDNNERPEEVSGRHEDSTPLDTDGGTSAPAAHAAPSVRLHRRSGISSAKRPHPRMVGREDGESRLESR